MRFARAQEQTLLTWWHQPQELRQPLLLRGARQVGKSTLVRQFAERASLRLAEVNLEKHPALDEVFRSNNMGRIIAALDGVLETRIADSQLLFLDEIQATPHAIASLRYFFEEHPEIPVVAAGSLLEFALGKGILSMPVGRIQQQYLGPVTFSEFLQAKNDQVALETINHLTPSQTLEPTVHSRLLRLQREFMFVGGMPRSVQTSLITKDPQACESVLQSILDTYREDFNKYAGASDRMRLQRVFGRIAGFLHRKVKYASLDPDEQARNTRGVIDLLSQARLVSKVYHSSANAIPLAAEMDPDIYKLLFLDVGLVNRLLGLDWSDVLNLDERALINEGPLAEQFVGQSLLTAFSKTGLVDPRLFYWLREGRSANAEVDFVVASGQNIVPIEVKSGKSGSMKSLLQFMIDKEGPHAVRFDLNPPSLQKITHRAQEQRAEFDLVSLPLYAVDALPRILAALR